MFGRGKKKSADDAASRLFFATDLHASEACFRKLLAAGGVYGAETVIMGGDCTGKMLIPVVADGAGYVIEFDESVDRYEDADALAAAEREIRDMGFYVVRVDQAEADRLGRSPDELMTLFRRTMLDTLQGWMDLAHERIDGQDLDLIVVPGNDDEFEVDDVLKRATGIEAAEGKVIRLRSGNEMLSIGWANETPWQTPRECSEEELSQKIELLADQIEDMPNAIFNIHVPPYGSGLDLAPELDENQRPIRGGNVEKPVGSTAVRDAIMRYQPLLSLHGHIHESRGVQRLGRTVSINPGSIYGEGTLQGVIVDLKPGEVGRYMLTSG